MAPKDQEATAFRTPKGIFCYKVMPFGLKNAGPTYQCLVNKIFEPLLGKTMEVYMDDTIVKTIQDAEHGRDLQGTFEILRTYDVKLILRSAFLGSYQENSYAS